LAIAGVEVGVGEVRFVPPGGVGMRGWVDVERGHGCMVVGVVDMCARNSWVVGWLRPRHPVPGGLRFRAVPCWVCTVFAMKQAVKSARLLRPSSAPTTSSIATTLGDNLGGEGPHQRGVGWRCYAPAADCGRPDQSLTAKVSSTFGWTAKGPWVSSGTRPCTNGALRIWRIFRTADTTPGFLGGSLMQWL
jgi:hypothetical protein